MTALERAARPLPPQMDPKATDNQQGNLREEAFTVLVFPGKETGRWGEGQGTDTHSAKPGAAPLRTLLSSEHF